MSGLSEVSYIQVDQRPLVEHLRLGVRSLDHNLAVGEIVTLLHPLLPVAGVSIWTMRECQQNDRTLADGCRNEVEFLGGQAVVVVVPSLVECRCAAERRDDHLLVPSRRRDCQFTDTPCISILKHLLQVQGGAIK